MIYILSYFFKKKQPEESSGSLERVVTIDPEV